MLISKETFRQTLTCVPVFFNVIVIGFCWGWAAPSLMRLQSPDGEFVVTADEASWIGSINEVGRIFSPFIAPLIVDNLGRRKTLIVVPILLFISWATLLFARHFYLLCAARIIFGIANGISDVGSAVYTIENCSASFRAVVGAVIMLVFYAALFAEFVFATYLSYTNVIIINIAVSVCALGVQYYGVESAFFLVMKGKHEEAKRSLMWIQGGEDESKISSEIENIKRNVDEQQQKATSVVSQISNAVNLRGILLVLGVHFSTSATGTGAISPWSSLIFVPSEQFNSNEFTIFYGVAQFVAVCISPFIVERINRRTLLILVLVGIGFSHVCIFTLFYFHDSGGYEISFYPWLIFASVTSVGSLYSIITPAIYVLRGELLPLSVRAIGGSAAIIIQSLTSFLSAKIFLPICEGFSIESNFLLYAITSASAVAFIYFCLPETRGKSLEEIKKLLKGERQQKFSGKSDIVDYFHKNYDDKFTPDTNMK